MSKLKFVDSHIHLYDTSRFDYPWLSAREDLQTSGALTDYLNDAGSDAPESYVLVEVDCRPDLALQEAMWARQFVEGSPPMLGMVAAVRLELRTALDHIDRLCDLGHVCGVRRLLDTAAEDLATSRLFGIGLERLGQRELPFDVCVSSGQLPDATRMVASYPETAFVLDHLGKPDIASGEWESWAQAFGQLASCDNLVAAKLSGLYSQAPPGVTRATLRRYLEFAVENLGPHRLMIGSDWPVLTDRATLSRWHEDLVSLIDPLSPDEQAAIYSGTAHRVYGRAQ